MTINRLVNGEIFALTSEEIEELKAKEVVKAASSIRSERDEKLTSCDWTQVIDAPVDQEAWSVYRQALRDIPAQEGFPNTVNWPTEPEI